MALEDALGLGHEALGLAQDEGDRAQDLGALSQDAGVDRDLAGGRDGRAADGLAQRLEQQVAGLGQLAADEDALGGEQVARAGDGAAEGAAGVGDDAPAADVARLRLQDDLAQGRRSPWRRRSGSRTASAPAKASRQPRLPQRQTGPPSSIVTCPISPAVPPAPW